MLTYLYDDSFEGFMSCICHSYYQKQPDNICARSRYVSDLFSEIQVIHTSPEYSERVIAALCSKVSKQTVSTVIYAFLSEITGIENHLHQYIRSSFALKRNIDTNLADPHVLCVSEAARKTLFESHRFKGFVRFRQLKDGTYYAPIEPDFNITELLAPHFSKRFPSDNWIIHDIKRCIAVFFQSDKKSWETVSVENFINIFEKPGQNMEYYSETEQDIQNLWKTYFKSIAISERKNLSLQRQFMPKKYWKYLIEKQ